MVKWIVFGLLLLFGIRSYSQNLDLVVTTSGDSIACKIDNINRSTIYIKVKTPGNKKWNQTIYKKSDVMYYCYSCIDSTKYDFKNGSSLINAPKASYYPKNFPRKSNMESASTDELNYYLEKAKKTKKKGVKMSIAGPLVATAGGLLAATTFSLYEDNGGFVFGSLLMLTGIGTTLVGVPILITGSSRVKNINEIQSSRGMTMEFAPAGNYNFQANNYQPGITLRIRF